jgi:RNA polymerase sigma-70 factor, ECF subfamily
MLSTVQLADDVYPAAHTGCEDERLIQALLNHDEEAYLALVRKYYTAMKAIALRYVHATEVAEEVVQETWMAVLQGLRHFEGRTSLRAWLFTIVANRARTHAKREGRTVAFSDWYGSETEDQEGVAPGARYETANHDRPGHWLYPPRSWEMTPEQQVLAQELESCVRQAIANLPAGQRAVITLRDLEGCTVDETCAALHLTEANQRVLLHRARSKVRCALEQYLGGAPH